MKDQHMNDIINKLKRQYDDMPAHSSVDEIMSQIKKERRRPRWGSFFHRWQAVALIILAVGIGSMLTIGQLSDYGSHSDAEMAREMAQEPAIEESNELHAYDQSEEENGTEENMTEKDTELTTEIITIEGEEEPIDIKPLINEDMQFRTYVDQRYEIETDETNEGYSIMVHANYGFGAIDEPFFKITKFPATFQSIEEVETVIREQITNLNRNYQEGKRADSFFSQHETELDFVSEIVFEAPESIVYIGLTEYDGTYYSITVDFIGEMYERIGADTVVLLKHAQFIDES